MTAADVQAMLDSGVDDAEIIRELVASGSWSKSGANEIVRFMTRGPDPLLNKTVPLPRPAQRRDQRRDPRSAGIRRGSWA